MSEIWKDIPHYEGLYSVSSEGRIRSSDRSVRASYGGTAVRKGKILRQAIKKSSKYKQVTLVDAEGKRKSMLVHRAVCMTFLGIAPLGHEVCHNDGDKHNNSVHNLRYDTPAGNAADRAKHGNFVCNLPGLEWCSSR